MTLYSLVQKLSDEYDEKCEYNIFDFVVLLLYNDLSYFKETQSRIRCLKLESKTRFIFCIEFSRYIVVLYDNSLRLLMYCTASSDNDFSSAKEILLLVRPLFELHGILPVDTRLGSFLF